MFTIHELIKDYIFVSLTAFLISATLTPIVRKKCQQKSVLDFPTDPRKIHSFPVPCLGGLAIYLAFFLPLFTIFFTTGAVYRLFANNLGTLLSLFLTSTIVFAIGVYDDIRGATVLQKLLVQITAAILIYVLGFKVTLISVPFVGSVSLGIFGFPLTILWIIGVTNAFNFIDGVDGLACGVGFFAVSTMFFLSLFLNHILTAFLAVALAGAILGFGLYNFAPASIFMGDSGSLFIGFVIAAISLHGSQKSSTAVVLLIPIVALGVPITDTLLAIIRRVGQGVSPFTADKEHIHHKLLKMGFSSRQVTLVLYAVSILLGITALLMTAVNNQLLALILLVLSVMTIASMKMLGYTADVIQINALAKERIQKKRRLLQRQKFAEEILTDLEAAVDLTTLKKEMIRYFESMEFDLGMFRLSQEFTRIHGRDVQEKILSESEEPLELVWYSMRYEDQRIPLDHIWTISIPLIVHDAKCGELKIGRYSNSHTSSFESMMLIENLSLGVKHSLSRIVS